MSSTESESAHPETEDPKGRDQPAAEDDGAAKKEPAADVAKKPSTEDPVEKEPPVAAKKEPAPAADKRPAGAPAKKEGPVTSKRPGVRKAGPRPPAGTAARGRGSLVRNVVIFVFLVGGLALVFGTLGSQSGGVGPVVQPKWNVGQVVDVEITLVTPDYRQLSCAMKDAIEGKHCAFEAQNRRGDKNTDSRANDKLLQPFTTTESTGRIQFLGAGLWMSPDVKKKLDAEDWDRPSPRFNVKCKYKVEGKTKEAFVQWKPGEGWFPANGWYTGAVSDCKIGG
jgi:hypothetical protein